MPDVGSRKALTCIKGSCIVQVGAEGDAQWIQNAPRVLDSHGPHGMPSLALGSQVQTASNLLSFVLPAAVMPASPDIACMQERSSQKESD